MKQFIKQITVTGADDSIPPESLVGLHTAYPFVEFGILCSKNNAGMPRFPSQAWIEKLRSIKVYPMKLSMHLCGSWVRSICAGDGLIFKDWISAYFDMFDRIQLNFHASIHHTYTSRFHNGLKSFNVPIIFQMDDVNNPLFFQSKDMDVDCYALYDISGGAGILPEYYPKPIGDYCGYAGGLSPNNLKEQLERLSSIVGKTQIWIDFETYARTDDGLKFDIENKVIPFLDIAKPYTLK